MKEEQLSKDQEERIDELKRAWADEIDAIPNENTSYFNHANSVKSYKELEDKYKLRIRAIMEEWFTKHIYINYDWKGKRKVIYISKR